MPRYKIADVVFDAELLFPYTKELCKDYEYSGEQKAEFSVKIEKEDVLKERPLMPGYPDSFLESIALFRKLCDYTLKNANGIIFHCSAIMVNGEAYLFTAPSGTGKSTHTRLWREVLKSKAVMINDDKPIVRFIDGDFYVYGTPWRGKHQIGENTRAKIKGICKIYQAKENVIRKISPMQMFITILDQTVRPKEEKEMDKLLTLLDKMVKSVELYELGCNISVDAAKLSINTMVGENL